MNKYYRAQEERNGIIKILENLSFDEKKEVLRIVDQSMINSANNVLANDDPPGKPLKKDYLINIRAKYRLKLFKWAENYLLRSK